MSAAEVGVAQAGGNGFESATSMVAHSLSMNHQGMKLSLAAREIIFDGVHRVHGRCPSACMELSVALQRRASSLDIESARYSIKERTAGVMPLRDG
jgi:hypothetical protein